MPSWQKLSETGYFLLQKDTCYTGQGQSSVNYCFRWLTLSASWFDHLWRLYLSIRLEVLCMKSSRPLTIPFCIFATEALWGDFLYLATYIVNISFDHLWTQKEPHRKCPCGWRACAPYSPPFVTPGPWWVGWLCYPTRKMGRAARKASCPPKIIGWTKSFSIWWGYLLGRRCKGFLRAL